MTAATQELERLQREAVAQRSAQREAELAAAEAQRVYAGARDGLVEAHATDADSKSIKVAQQALEKSQAVAEAVDVRRAGAQRRVERAQAAADAFEGERSGDLLAELDPDGERAVASLDDAMGALVAADQLWRSVAAKRDRLVRAMGRDPQRETHDRHGAEEVVRAARLTRQNVILRSPVPHWNHEQAQRAEAARVASIRERRKQSGAAVQVFSTPVPGSDEAA